MKERGLKLEWKLELERFDEYEDKMMTEKGGVLILVSACAY
jgi:hypothetical protein